MGTFSVVQTPATGNLRVGLDFVDAVAGRVRSHGWIERRRCVTRTETRHEWESTLDVATTERVLRRTLADYGCECIGFMSQAVDASQSPSPASTARAESVHAAQGAVKGGAV